MNRPEEKAKAIIEKFRDVTQDWDERDLEWVDNIDKAKEAALICVDEIIATGLPAKGENVQPWNLIYWQKTKEEIQKL